MKGPGIFYRISFLVILNSVFIFLAVTLVSIDNNQTKINHLIEYRFEFITQYFRAEVETLAEQEGFEITHVAPELIVNHLFERSQRFMEGLAGLALLTPTGNKDGYHILASIHRSDLQLDRSQAMTRVAEEADPKVIWGQGIQVGARAENHPGELKTVYIPWKNGSPGQVLAITFIPGDITGGDEQYNYTLILLFMVITLVTLLIVNLLFRSFIRPLHHLMLGMEKTAEGKVLYKIEGTAGDEIGRVTGAYNTMVDTIWSKRQELTRTLDQLSKANESLAESKKFLAKLIENAPFAVIVTDPAHRILIFSKAAAEIFEIDREEALNRDFVTFFPLTPEKVYPADESSVQTTKEEMICLKGKDETFPALVNRVPVRDDGQAVRAYLFIIRDITESKGFYEMMVSIDRMASRGVMASQIAHEINNYLAVILGNIELLPLLLQKGDMAKVDKKFEVLKNSVAKIQRFSEGLAGDMNEQAIVEPNDLNQLIENLVAFLRPQNHYDGIRFRLELWAGLPLVDIDRGQIQQMLTNLLSNAAGALQEKTGEKEILITTGVVEESRTARITVTDNAGGLPAELEKVIFRERYLGRRRGRGFGLLIVKRIVDRHGGAISYASLPGEGTSFTIDIPVRAVIPKADTVPSPIG